MENGRREATSGRDVHGGYYVCRCLVVTVVTRSTTMKDVTGFTMKDRQTERSHDYIHSQYSHAIGRAKVELPSRKP